MPITSQSPPNVEPPFKAAMTAFEPAFRTEPRASASGQPGTLPHARVNWMFNPMPTRLLTLITLLTAAVQAQPPDLILYNAKLITVDPQFRIADSLAIRADRIQAGGG